MKQFVPDLKLVFYWTDSPTSQFRNKTIFHIISEHKEECNCVTSWNYFRACHGKGPCDGVGGTVKRLADDYVKQNKVVIQDAADFFAWSRDKQSESKIDYTFVSTDEYKLSKVSLQSGLEVIKPVQGTMKVHAAVGLGNNSVMVRDVSCFCFNCFEGVKFCEESCCDGWEKHNLLKKQKKKGETNRDVPITPVASSSNKEGNAEVAKSFEEILTLTLEIGEYVAAIYIENTNVYIGKIVEVDEHDVFITFMEAFTTDLTTTLTFKWPKYEDSVRVAKGLVLSVLQAPEKVGKSGRSFRFNPDVLQAVIQTFDA